MSEHDGADKIISTLNREWIRLYGGVEVSDPKLVCARIVQLVADRDAWVFNARQAEKEYARLERKLNEQGRN